jgi:hypothetical protein
MVYIIAGSQRISKRLQQSWTIVAKMLSRDSTTERMLSGTYDEGYEWETCEKQSPSTSVSYNGLRYWTIAIATHGVIFISLLSCSIWLSSTWSSRVHANPRLETSLVPAKCMSTSLCAAR